MTDEPDAAPDRLQKSADAFRTITEVADLLDVQQHVLRFWETKFTQIKPMKRAGSRRYYRPEDVRLLQVIRRLLHEEGYTIRGVQKLLRENGIKTVLDWAEAGTPVPAPETETPRPVAPPVDMDALRRARADLTAAAESLRRPIRDAEE